MSKFSSLITSAPESLSATAELGLRQLSEGCAAAGLAEPRLDDLPGDAGRVWVCSDYVAQSCARNPAMLADLIDSGDLCRVYPAEHYHESTTAALLATSSETELRDTLRRLKRRELVRIAWRDIAGLADFEETVRDTSAFANAALDATLQRLHHWQTQRRGVPTGESGSPQRMVVLALGKLGASELNFSSDIDLIFTFPESGETLGAKRSLSNEEFFIRLSRRYINVLSETTADGFAFRVDMRLRPFGASGRLVCSMSAMEDYYQIHGRDWERYAFIRARPVAGDLEAGNELLERLRPFVFRRYIDFGALESLREMKATVSAEVKRKGLIDNIKLGPGGIREVEFIGQAFQLVRGGRVPELRGRQIISVLEELRKLEYLPDYAVKELSDAYRFLRTTEHRLQEVEEQQTHTVPNDANERLRLAYGMGFADWQSFSRELEKFRARVQSHFDQVFGATDEQAPETDSLSALWEGTLTDDQVLETLAQAGFADGDAVMSIVSKLRASYTVRGLEERGRARLSRLVPALLRTVATRHDPLATLQRVITIIEGIARRSVYLALLVERPLALSQLVKLCEASPLVARQFARYPLLLDELLDARTLYAPLDRNALLDDMRTRLASVADQDIELEMDALRHFKQSNLLRVAAADLTHAIDLDEVSERLTQIAEVALEACLRLAWRDLCRRHGEPLCTVSGARRRAPFCIVAYGKFGGQELSYGSDLDLVFVHGSSGEEQHTDGDKRIENSVFFSRLAQRTIHFLSTHTAVGALYSVDARLRPSGADGLLVTSLESFERYQLEQAWTWEHQAVVRARVVAGDTELAAQFRDVRCKLLLLERDAGELKAQVRDMRARMQRELGTQDDALFDIKQDRGGIADIEFMVQYGALAWAPKLRNYLHFTDNLQLVQAMADSALMTPHEAEVLSDAYREYRAAVHRLALAEKPAVVPAAQFAGLREKVGALWQRLLAN